MANLELIFSALAGFGLGLFFFGGLWWTVRQLPHSAHPSLLMGGSLLARFLVTLGGFYLIFDEDYIKLVLALIGFIFARALLKKRLAPKLRTVATE